MPWYPRVARAVAAAVPSLLPTQAANLALLVSAILAKRTLCLSELARAYPTPAVRRVPAPKHDLLHRLKRLWRFLGNERVAPLAVQCAAVPHAVARLGCGGRLGLAVDWTMFDAELPSGRRVRYQVLRIAAPCRGRAAPLLQLAYDRDRLPADRSQNQLEEEALWAVVAALPPGVRYGLYHGRPRDLWLNVALCWRVAKCRTGKRPPKEPWYLATSLGAAARAVAWYWRRGWIEQSFKDSKSRFRLKHVQVGTPERLGRLLLALTLALCWLLLAALPSAGALPPGWHAHVAQRGRASLLSLALAWLDERRDLPAACLPAAP